MNAPVITKTLRSRNSQSKQRETRYAIKGLTFDALTVYSKGTLVAFEGREVFYFLISSKQSTDD
jgi:hypothetical protein